MTIKEATEYWKQFKEEIPLAYAACNQPIYKEDMQEQEMATTFAIDALEKQLPKHVLGRKGEFTKDDYKGTRYTYYACPNCKKAVKHHTEFCDKCGQHLVFPFISHTPYVPGEKQEIILNWKE